ncbi:hypothetical protein COU54_01435 [Candidatus Pacearchaeota archaeon CG10_big_fil_rev_8_21_14_0_10_31_24]|nr:MAG: hypothetical protein COU54_01435 [Candidatus Pacearchaeota archaeon CG10_big_fil_rev_8_21_14_0_10_31_24]
MQQQRDDIQAFSAVKLETIYSNKIKWDMYKSYHRLGNLQEEIYKKYFDKLNISLRKIYKKYPKTIISINDCLHDILQQIMKYETTMTIQLLNNMVFEKISINKSVFCRALYQNHYDVVEWYLTNNFVSVQDNYIDYISNETDINILKLLFDYGFDPQNYVKAVIEDPDKLLLAFDYGFNPY